MLVGAIFHPLWNNSYSLTGLLVRPIHKSAITITLKPHTHHSMTCYGSRVPTGLGPFFIQRSCSAAIQVPTPRLCQLILCMSALQSAPCLFPGQAGVLSISERLLVLSPGLNALVSIPFPSGCQHILQSGLKSSHTRTIVLITSVSRFWSFQAAQIKNPAWPLFFLLTPDSWGPWYTNGVSYRELCVC